MTKKKIIKLLAEKTVPGTTKLYSSKSVKFSVSAPFKRDLN